MGQFCSNTCTILLLAILICASSLIKGSEGTCSKPADVANANLRSKYRDIETFNESSEVEYDCNIGYSITGRSRNRKCLKSRNWSPVEFDCELIRCTYLPHPENGRRTDANNGAGETTRFSCNPGYSLKGPSQLVCRTDGEWSPRYTPKCEPILCPELSSLRNGDIFQDTSDGVRNNYGSIAQYTCNYGFTINGTRSRQSNRRCEADGTWDGHNYFCDTEKCEPIEFYGGNLQYFGSIHRAEGTYAYYSCHDGYTMSPPGIDYSECKRTSLRWEPEPPKCYGNCRFEEYQPIDSSVVWRQRARTDRDAIIHGEKIIYSCTNQRWNELCVRPNDHDLCTYYLENFETTCINGTFDKINRDTLITCPERRCSITYQTNTCVWPKGENCIKENYKIQSQSSVNVKCNDGNRFELYENVHKIYPEVDSSTMKCDRGNLLTDLSCVPKRCDMSDIPTNRFTSRTPDKSHIMHNETIVYRCKNDQYELYVKSTDSFPRAFTSTCRFGDFDVLRQNFPMCIERRCDITYQTSVFENACFWTDDDHGRQCKPEIFKIASGSSVIIGCKDGYELYDTIRKTYIDVERSEMKCIKGRYSENLSCKHKRCALSHLPMNNFTIRTPEGTHIEHGQSVYTQCNEGYDRVGHSDNTCKNGEWKYSFPQCTPKPCIKIFQDGEIVWHGSNKISRPTGSDKTYTHGTNLHIECASGYTMETQPQDSKVMTTKCVLGVWKPLPSCVPKSCEVPAVSNVVLKSKGTPYYNHMEEVQYECKEGYHFEQEYSKGKNNLRTERHLSSKCELGNWSKQIPERCYPDGCKLSILAGSRYFIYENNTNYEILERDLFPHGTQVSTECTNGYDMVKQEDGSLADVLNPEVICSLGSWKNVHQCMKRCAAIHSSRVTNSSDDTVTLDFKHGNKTNIQCMGDREITCKNGTWDGYDEKMCQNNTDYNYKDIDDSINGSAYTGCEIPRDPLFNIYDTEGGQELDPGTNIENGTTVFVKCSYTENYEYTFHSTFIRCLNGVLVKENFICPEFPYGRDFECEITNGQVSKKFLNEVLVSCNDGYLINQVEKNKTCECTETGLDCKSVPNPPTCVPENCKIPEKNEYDSGLTIYVPTDGSDVGLSRGMEVEHGDSVYFKCPHTETDHFEPDYKRLECMKGKWLKVATNEEWLKLNSSDFPKCRTAICIPLCENGGTCVGNNTCKCQPQSTGTRCEKVECDRECNDNGGKCIAPGKCGQCPDGKSGTNCKDQGCPRPGNVPIIKDAKENYNIGETIDSAHFVCPPNDELMPRNGMSCLAGGWTDTAECIPKIKYVIQIQTGPDTFAGTGDKVYVNLHGEKYSTGPLNVPGSYQKNNLDENNIWSVDVTPIKKITVSKATRWWQWQVKYVSIFVEKDDHYYVFDGNNIWIKDEVGTDIELSYFPEKCVHKFNSRPDVYPFVGYRHNGKFLGEGKKMTERTCKQKCLLDITHCVGVYYSKTRCFGFDKSDAVYFKTNTAGSLFLERSCL